MNPLEERIEELETELSRIKIQFKALAEDWMAASHAPLTSPTGRVVYSKCAREAYVVLNQGQELPTAPFASAAPL